LRFRAGEAQGPFEIGRVVGLFGVDTDEVERAEPLGFDLGRVVSAVPVRISTLPPRAGAGDVSARDIGMFGAHFERDKPAVRRARRAPDMRAGRWISLPCGAETASGAWPICPLLRVPLRVRHTAAHARREPLLSLGSAAQ
jgi:hypothetical protein